MVENCIGPSRFHLKKQLSAIRKSSLLRDPQTCPFWRSPTSLRSVDPSAAYSLSYGNEINRGLSPINQPSKLLQVESSSAPTPRNGNSKKHTYLYNWGHHSCKSSDSGIKLDGDSRQESVQNSVEDILKNYQEEIKDFVSVPRAKMEKPKNPIRRKCRQMQTDATRKQHFSRKLAISKMLDDPSSSVELSDDTGDTPNCNSEDLQRKMQELIQTSEHASEAASPLLSSSACRNWSRTTAFSAKETEREGLSCFFTPLSGSAHVRCRGKKSNTVDSWDGSKDYLSGDEGDLMDLRQGCGISCYSSKIRKDKASRGRYSPSLSDTLRLKGSSFLCGSQTRDRKERSSSTHQIKFSSKSQQGLPLLTSSYDGGRSSDCSSDSMSIKLEELELEGLSRLDGRRWSNCRSNEGSEVAAPPSDCAMHGNKSLSWRYRPRLFKEIVGQNIVVQSLNNAILKGRIAPAYLFQGPRGTGKTSCARIFATALNCSSAEENKPCGFCKECSDFTYRNGSSVREVDAANNKSINRISFILKNLQNATRFRHYRTFVVDECHILSPRMWSHFIKFLEEPPSNVVFIFITVDPEKLPRAVVSRCQKYLFLKIKEVDIVSRLRKLSAKERLDIEDEALDLIALNCDGSMRDAEIMLDQLSLLGKRITATVVNNLVGSIPDEKLLDLLENAMSSNKTETVRRSRELLDSGVDPIALMSQLATLIVDVIAGTNHLASSNSASCVLGREHLNEAELDRLHQALKILSDSEKQLRHSTDQSTWFTAALLQLGSGNLESNSSSTGSSKNNQRRLKTSTSVVAKESSTCRLPTENSSSRKDSYSTVSMPESTDFHHLTFLPFSHKENSSGKRLLRCASPGKLDDIWKRCVNGCHTKKLRHLLSTNGRLLSISQTEGSLIACLAFEDANAKSRAEGFLSSITNSMETVLKSDVKVRVELLPDKSYSGGKQDFSQQNQPGEKMWSTEEVQTESNETNHSFVLPPPRKNVDYHEDNLQGRVNTVESTQEQNKGSQRATIQYKESNGGIAMKSTQRAVIEEEISDHAWLQEVEKGSTGTCLHIKPERNQILPRSGFSCQDHDEGSLMFSISSKHWENEGNHYIRDMKCKGPQKERNGVLVNNQALIPSALHFNNMPANSDEENKGYDSEIGCDGLLCWKTKTSHSHKGKQGTLVRSKWGGRFSCFDRQRSMTSRLR